MVRFSFSGVAGPLVLLAALGCSSLAGGVEAVEGVGVAGEEARQTLELADGAFMSFPLDARENQTAVVNFNFNVSKAIEGRGRGSDKKLLRRILPMFIIPFLIQSAILPMFLSTLKMMLVKSLMVGKVALLLIAFNALRTSNAFKNRGEERLADVHYGYHGAGMEEYGAYVNARSLPSS